MFSYLEILRPGNCLMSAIAVFIGGLLVTGWNVSPFFYLSPIYMSLFVVLVITGAGNVINDWVDVSADKINRPKRPIPSGRISRRSALIYALLLFASGILVAGYINYLTFVIAIFNSLLLIVYSTHLQDKTFLGNMSVAYLSGSTFIFGAAALGDVNLVLILFVLASMATFSREIVKDLEDIEGDKVRFLKKIAIDVKHKITDRFRISRKGRVKTKVRKKHALFVAEFSLILSVFISPLPYYFGILGYSYLAIVILADAVFLYCVYLMLRAKVKKDMNRISGMIKIGMNIGFIAFIVGVLF